jgi:hypothetical protein
MCKKLQKAVCITAASAMGLAGCAAPRELEAIPVSPTQYADLACEQLNADAQRVLARYVELGGKIDETVKQDQALGSLALLTRIVWPEGAEKGKRAAGRGAQAPDGRAQRDIAGGGREGLSGGGAATEDGRRTQNDSRRHQRR